MLNFIDPDHYLKNFYSPEFYIDSFQNTKRLVTDKVITDKTLNKVAHSYIDAQTLFAKMLVNNTLEVAKVITETATDKIFQKSSKKAA